MCLHWTGMLNNIAPKKNRKNQLHRAEKREAEKLRREKKEMEGRRKKSGKKK